MIEPASASTPDPETRRLRTNIFGMLGYLCALYVGVVAIAHLAQRALVFPAPSAQIAAPPSYREVSYSTADGIRLEAFYRPARSGKPTLVFFHGNGDNLGGAGVATAKLAEQGYGLLLPEYRGYAGNPGKPSEQGFMKDGRAAIGWLRGQGLSSDRMVLIGNSIGSGVAVQMAVEERPAALVLISPFTALTDVAVNHLPWLPVRTLMHDRFDNLAKIGAVKAPILILHGRNDRTIPFEQARTLAQAAHSASLIPFAGMGHELGYTAAAQQAELTWLSRLK